MRRRCLAIAGVFMLVLGSTGCNSSGNTSIATSAAEKTGTIPQCVPNGINATIVGPIPGVSPGDPSHDYPWLASDLDLAGHGYVEEEYFFCGVAPVGSYTTRMIVRRPKSAAASNGAVLVEWLNVTSDYDLDALWQLSSEHIMRAGYTYIGISAQRVGVYATPNGLKAWSPKRYAQLNIPQGNSLDSSFVFDPAAYVIYGNALRALKQPGAVDPIGGLPVKWIIATGGSQSAGTLSIYYDAFQLVDQAADGFMPFILSVSSLLAALGNDTQLNVNIPTLTALVGKPLFLVNSETDPSFIRPPDSSLFRLWETAGATHVDEDGTEALRPLILRDLGTDITAGDSACQYRPRSRIPFRYVLNAAMDHMLAWLQNGTLPPHGQPFQYDVAGQLVRDFFGNVLGGIRLSQHEVPTALNRRDNNGCDLEGHYQPFDALTLRSLYPTHTDYVSLVTKATEQNLQSGYINNDDAQATETAAQAADIPP